MKVVAAYLLAQLGGNAKPGAADIKKILASVGADAEDAKITLLLKELEGKDIAAVIAAGTTKLASAAAAAPAGAAPAAAAAPAAGKGAPPKEEKKKVVEEKKEEEDDDMGFSLFD